MRKFLFMVFALVGFMSQAQTFEFSCNVISETESGDLIVEATDYTITLHGQHDDYTGIPTNIMLQAGEDGIIDFSFVEEITAGSRYSYTNSSITIFYDRGEVHYGSHIIPRGYSQDVDDTKIADLYNLIVGSVEFTTMRDGTISNNQNNMIIVPNIGGKSTTTTYYIIDEDGNLIPDFNRGSLAEARAFASQYTIIPGLFTKNDDDEIDYYREASTISSTVGFLYQEYLAINGNLLRVGGHVSRSDMFIANLPVPSEWDGGTLEAAFNFMLSLDGINIRQLENGKWTDGNVSSHNLYTLYDLIGGYAIPLNESDELDVSSEDYYITFGGQSSYPGIPETISIQFGETGSAKFYIVAAEGERYRYNTDNSDLFSRDDFGISYENGVIKQGTYALPPRYVIDTMDNLIEGLHTHIVESFDLGS